MRSFALVLLLAACGGSSREPAWPKQHVSENDGGESLAPHGSRSAAVAITSTGDDEAKPATAAIEAKPAATADATPAAAVPAAPATEEVLQTEEIVIEVDE